MEPKELLRAKNDLILRVELAKQVGKAKDVRALATQAYALESEVAEQHISSGRPGQAAVNLVSAASLLQDARREDEARRMLARALDLCDQPGLRRWIADRLTGGGNNHFGSVFKDLPARIADNARLRRPQREAYAAVHGHFAEASTPALVQLPVGCGKTGTMAILPFGLSRGRMLVVGPNLEIATNLQRNLDYSNPENFWRKTGVLSGAVGPTVAFLDAKASVLDCDRSDIVVSNIQQLTARGSEKWLANYARDYFDMIMVDEVHHSPAESWQRVLHQFPTAKVVGFTATPLRSDGQVIEGERVYNFPISKAIIEGYVKDLASVRIEPEEIFFEIRGDRQKHSLAEVMKLREETWFSRGVALSPACNKSIVDESLRRMNELRSAGSVKHQIIAAACSVDHAKSIRSLYAERGYRAEVIYSELSPDEQDRVRGKLKDGSLDVIVQVAMLGEGADYPQLSVAAIFRPFRHVVPYIQFIGRVMRVIRQDSPGHLDNRGYVVSHVGLHIDRWWAELRKFDADDQALMEAIAKGERAFGDGDGSGGTDPGERRRFSPTFQVLEEIIRAIHTDRFLPEDVRLVADDVIAMLGERGLSLDLLGISRDELEQRLSAPRPDTAAVTPLPVQPQRARQEARRRLGERVNSGAKQLLNELGVSIGGVELLKAQHAANNLASAIILLNRQVNLFLGIGVSERDLISEEQAKRAHDAMDALVDQVAAAVRPKIVKR